MMHSLTEEIISHVEPRGSVLRRRFEEVLISLGRIDGLLLEDTVHFVSSPDSRDLGTGEVIALDDLVAVVRYEPQGADNLTVGDQAYIVADDQDSEETAEEENQQSAPEQTSQLGEIVQQLFQVR
jgi:hypothetical protein